MAKDNLTKGLKCNLSLGEEAAGAPAPGLLCRGPVDEWPEVQARKSPLLTFFFCHHLRSDLVDLCFIIPLLIGSLLRPHGRKKITFGFSFQWFLFLVAAPTIVPVSTRSLLRCGAHVRACFPPMLALHDWSIFYYYYYRVSAFSCMFHLVEYDFCIYL